MDNENTSAPTNEAAPTKSTTRRAFIKGTAFALPAVVTLHSGATTAALSVSMCVTKRQSLAPPCITSNPDTYQRSQVQVYHKLTRYTTSSGETCYRYDNTDSSCQNQYFDGVDKTVGACIRDMNGNIVTDTSLVFRSSNLNCSSPSMFPLSPLVLPPKQYAIKYFCADPVAGGGTLVSVGDPCGFPPPNTVTVSITGGCLTSLIGRHA